MGQQKTPQPVAIALPTTTTETAAEAPPCIAAAMPSPSVAETLTLPELFDAVNGIGGKFRNDGNAVVVDARQEALTVAIATALADHQQCLIFLYPAPRVVNSDVLAVNSSEILTDEEFERELMGM